MGTSLGELLQSWRVGRGLSRRGLAASAGISHTTLGRWETGKFLPCLPELEATLNALDATPTQRRQALQLLHAPRAIHQLHTQTLARTEILLGGQRPSGGDLLRALRRRRGKTQGDVAAALGVTTSTISRWESGQSYPSAEELQTLCYLLGAQEAELIALTMHRFDLGQMHTENTLDALADCLETIRWKASGHRDLDFLALEARLWECAAHQPAAREILASVWAYYADYLSWKERFAEARDYANRALDSARETRLPSRLQIHAAIAGARAAAYRSAPFAPKRGLEELRPWLADDIALRPAYRAWLRADAALYTAQLGQNTDALVQSKEACQIATGSLYERELRFRKFDRAEVLLRSGQPEAALSIMPDTLIQGIEYARPALLAAEAAGRIGDQTRASEYLRHASALIVAHDLQHLVPRCNALMNDE